MARSSCIGLLTLLISSDGLAQEAFGPEQQQALARHHFGASIEGAYLETAGPICSDCRNSTNNLYINGMTDVGGHWIIGGGASLGWAISGRTMTPFRTVSVPESVEWTWGPGGLTAVTIPAHLRTDHDMIVTEHRMNGYDLFAGWHSVNKRPRRPIHLSGSILIGVRVIHLKETHAYTFHGLTDDAILVSLIGVGWLTTSQIRTDIHLDRSLSIFAQMTIAFPISVPDMSSEVEWSGRTNRQNGAHDIRRYWPAAGLAIHF